MSLATVQVKAAQIQIESALLAAQLQAVSVAGDMLQAQMPTHVRFVPGELHNDLVRRVHVFGSSVTEFSRDFSASVKEFDLVEVLNQARWDIPEGLPDSENGIRVVEIVTRALNDTGSYLSDADLPNPDWKKWRHIALIVVEVGVLCIALAHAAPVIALGLAAANAVPLAAEAIVITVDAIHLISEVMGGGR